MHVTLQYLNVEALVESESFSSHLIFSKIFDFCLKQDLLWCHLSPFLSSSYATFQMYCSRQWQIGSRSPSLSPFVLFTVYFPSATVLSLSVSYTHAHSQLSDVIHCGRQCRINSLVAR